ncbi:MAG: pyridoxal-phosphate dependent enzyme [Cytophagales bacterium]|nr:pyridoxal-phosphate dependent enzyme [Bernardetiaceae bacterium]MDW8211627.1 pyridoxal-phosphate dependent enzyme [Cytophagales bacterium]
MDSFTASIGKPSLQYLPPSFAQDCQVAVLRLDNLHPHINGNKWFKLKYNLLQAKAEGKTTLLTFGGAYSNHLRATAVAGHYFGFHTIGFVRGEPSQNPALHFIKQMGMQLHYLNRSTYRQIHQCNDLRSWLENLFPGENFDNCYILPEGGSNPLAVKGCAQIWRHVPTWFDYALCACGTGATLAGLAAGNPSCYALGISVLKGGFMDTVVSHLLDQSHFPQVNNWKVIDEYHFGGYAKSKPELVQFIANFIESYSIPLEPVYTGKLFFAAFDLLQKGFFPKGSKILILHTGGVY